MTRERRFDPGALVVGLWLFVVGVVAASAGDGFLSNAMPVLLPGTLVVVGLGLLLRPRARRSAGEYGSSYEIGAERGEYG
ncbi:MAG: hypothetical protein ACRD0G_03205 [Acidimicrobiales bacterium]